MEHVLLFFCWQKSNDYVWGHLKKLFDIIVKMHYNRNSVDGQYSWQKAAMLIDGISVVLLEKLVLKLNTKMLLYTHNHNSYHMNPYTENVYGRGDYVRQK